MIKQMPTLLFQIHQPFKLFLFLNVLRNRRQPGIFYQPPSLAGDIRCHEQFPSLPIFQSPFCFNLSAYNKCKTIQKCCYILEKLRVIFQILMRIYIYTNHCYLAYSSRNTHGQDSVSKRQKNTAEQFAYYIDFMNT